MPDSVITDARTTPAAVWTKLAELKGRKIGVGGGHEALARKLEHCGDDAQIGDVTGTDLAVHHHAARQGKVDHGWVPGGVNAAC